MTARITNPRRLARTIGALFLLTILAGIFAQGFVSERLINFSDAAATAKNILSNKGLFQFGFAVYLLEMASQVATAALWYLLLRPVSGSIALSAAFLELTGCIIKSFARVFFISTLFVLSGSPALAAFSTPQSQSLALLVLKINDQGAAMALAFFGFSTTLNGFLMFRSTFLPKFLGVVGMISGIGWLSFLYPALGYRVFMLAALISLASSAVMIFWLLVKGVDEEKWRQCTAE